jgi:hypothetical protein
VPLLPYCLAVNRRNCRKGTDDSFQFETIPKFLAVRCHAQKYLPLRYERKRLLPEATQLPTINRSSLHPSASLSAISRGRTKFNGILLKLEVRAPTYMRLSPEQDLKALCWFLGYRLCASLAFPSGTKSSPLLPLSTKWSTSYPQYKVIKGEAIDNLMYVGA